MPNEVAKSFADLDVRPEDTKEFRTTSARLEFNRTENKRFLADIEEPK